MSANTAHQDRQSSPGPRAVALPPAGKPRSAPFVPFLDGKLLTFSRRPTRPDGRLSQRAGSRAFASLRRRRSARRVARGGRPERPSRRSYSFPRSRRERSPVRSIRAAGWRFQSRRAPRVTRRAGTPRGVTPLTLSLPARLHCLRLNLAPASREAWRLPSRRAGKRRTMSISRRSRVPRLDSCSSPPGRQGARVMRWTRAELVASRPPKHRRCRAGPACGLDQKRDRDDPANGDGRTGPDRVAGRSR